MRLYEAILHLPRPHDGRDTADVAVRARNTRDATNKLVRMAVSMGYADAYRSVAIEIYRVR